MKQIDFYDKDVVSTLLPIYSMEPDEVFFLVDQRRFQRKELSPMVEAIQDRLPETRVEICPVNVDEIESIYDALTGLLGERPGEFQYMDLTGGGELPAACGLRVCEEFGVTPIHIDVRREYVYNVFTMERICPVKHLKLRECLLAAGAERIADSHELPVPEEYGRICEMAEYIFGRLGAWQELNTEIGHYGKENPGLLDVVLPRKFDEPQFSRVQDLIREFERLGFWARSGKHQFRFANHRYKSYLTTFGTWLELYIYIKALDWFDEAALGAVIDWDDSDYMETGDNEIDVLGMKRSAPVLISCKMRKPVAGDAYEVGYLAERLGGSAAKAVIATTFPVRKVCDTPKGMYQRLKKMNIGLIETGSFRDKPAADIFNQALMMIED